MAETQLESRKHIGRRWGRYLQWLWNIVTVILFSVLFNYVTVVEDHRADAERHWQLERARSTELSADLVHLEERHMQLRADYEALCLETLDAGGNSPLDRLLDQSRCGPAGLISARERVLSGLEG